MAQPDYTQVLVGADDTIRKAIEIIDASGSQIALVVDRSGVLLGTVTDGDIRGGILQGIGLEESVTLIMNPDPTTARVGTSRDQLLALMASRSIKQVPLLDQQGQVVGLELLDILAAGPRKKHNPAIILAGGLGTRLRPLTDNKPKPLLEIGGKPILELILQQLSNSGFSQVFIAVNYRGEDIEACFGDGGNQGLSIQYLRESKPMGTAGPFSLIPRPIEFPSLVVNGDLLSKVDFDSLLEYHSNGKYDLTIGVKEYLFQIPFGIVSVEGDRAVGFEEKPEERRLINAGIYVLDPEVLDMVPPDTYFDMNQLIESVMAQPDRKVGAFPIHEYWMDIGRNADYRQAQSDYYIHFTQT